jgi:NAD-dependent deacetylase
MFEHEIAQVSELLRQATYAIALTGAGISRPSGIPDFRSADSGLWNHCNPYEVGSIHGFRYKPEAFYEWIRPLATLILNAEPNAAHVALARLESLGYLKGVITQNIDLLHARAGSKAIYEVHGHIREVTCIACFSVYSAEPLLHEFLNDSRHSVPRCAKCGGVLKPNVILFGEQLPAQVLLRAEQETRRADLMLVAGSSLEVFPVADFPRRVKEKGGKLVLINLVPTEYDSMADIVIHDDVARVLPLILSRLDVEGGEIDEC